VQKDNGGARGRENSSPGQKEIKSKRAKGVVFQRVLIFFGENIISGWVRRNPPKMRKSRNDL